MKKLFGRTFGSIQKKMVNLVMGILIITVVVFAFLSFFQMKMLTGVVKETRAEQEQSISRSSKDTMNQVLNHSMVSSTGLQAEVVDSDFSEVVHNVSMLQSMAQGLWENRNSIEPLQVELPDPSNDGKLSAMALCEAGVDPAKSEYLGVIGHLSIPMIAMIKNSDKLQACYIGLADGTHLGIDSMSSDKLDENGELIPFPVRERPWYKGAVENGGISFTGVVTDAFNGKMCITCSAPIICDGELIGVAGADIILESLTEIIHASADMAGFSFVVNDSGKVVLAPEDNGLFSAQVSEEAEDLRETTNPELASFINDALVKATDIKLISINGKDYYLAGAPLPTVGWALIAIVDKGLTEASEKQLIEEYDQINLAASSRYRSGTRTIMIYSIAIILLIAVIGFFTALFVSHRITKPIEEMTKDINNSSAAGRLFEMKDAYRTDDEIEILAESFADLSQKTKKYIQDITRITSEKERVSTELKMANQIQKSMLPSVFPPFPKKTEFDIYASMDPAREVGGDFYDFFLIDDNHLCLVMADVSGKGVPAALFMMITKVILQSCAMLGQDAAEILFKTNQAICSSNQVEMFVTVWTGILEISTGKITAANAGHEYPAIMKNGEFKLLKDKHGFVIGGMDDVRYTEYEIDLEPGDKLFLYTDGVPEATDQDNRMFGTQRMLDALNKNPQADLKQILTIVRADVDEFVGGAEQFDDLTMMCLEYKGQAEV